MIAENGSYIEIALATLVANARYFLMSAAFAQRLDPEMPFFHRFLLAVKVKQLSESKIGIFHLDKGARNRLFRHEIRSDNRGRGLRFINLMCIFRIGKEGQPTLDALFYFTYRANNSILISNNLSINELRDLRNPKFHN